MIYLVSKCGSLAVYSSASVDNILFDLHKSSHPTKPRSIMAKYSLNEVVQREKESKEQAGISVINYYFNSSYRSDSNAENSFPVSYFS